MQRAMLPLPRSCLELERDLEKHVPLLLRDRFCLFVFFLSSSSSSFVAYVCILFGGGEGFDIDQSNQLARGIEAVHQ